MAKKGFELNRAGVAELMKSPEMVAVLNEYAQTVASRAGGGYETNLFIGRNRANVSVAAATQMALKDNMQNNTLLKAISGGEG